MRSDPVHFQFGSVAFTGFDFPLRLSSQTVSGLRTGPEIQREGREGVIPFRLDDLSRGFLPQHGIFDWGRDKGRIYRNEGLLTHLPGLCCLPYVSTNQAAMAAVDASGFRAANKRVHAVNTSLGASGLRHYAFLGSNMYKDTSTSDPAITAPATADGLSNNVTAAAEMVWNNTGYLVVATDGTTNDISGTADPTQDTVSWTTLAALSGTPYISALAYMPQIGPGGINVIVGNDGATNQVWYTLATDSVPATLSPVVLSDTKDALSTTTTTASSVDLSIIGVDNSTATDASGFMVVSGGGASNKESMNAGETTGRAIFGNGNFTALPRGRRVTGIQVVIAHTEQASADAVYPLEVIIRVGGSTSMNLADGAELGTSGTDTYGGSSVTGGLNITTDDLAELAVYTSYYVNSSAQVANGDIDITDVDVTITYATDGNSVAFGQGGWSPGKSPSNPSRLALIAPPRTDTTAVTVPREVWFLDFDWDPATYRPVMEISKPYTGIPYVEDATWYQGGLAVAGGNSAGTGLVVKLIDSRGDTRDLGFPKVHGSTAVRVVSMFARGTALFAWVANADSTDCQLWMYFDGRWMVYGALFSKTLGAAMSTTPLAFAERDFNQGQNYIYCFYPSSTNTAVMRQFVPLDPFDDPFLTNTSIVKQDGPLDIYTLELNVLPEESNKVLLAYQIQTRKVDNTGAGGSYGTARWRVNTAGDFAFTATAADATFGDGTSSTTATFTDYNIVSSGDPGVAYRTQIWRGSADHQASSTKTPNLLPVQVSLAAEWPELEEFGVVLSTVGQQFDLVTLTEQFKTLKNSKAVQRFLGGGLDIPAKLVNWEFTYHPTLGIARPTWNDVASAVLHFRRSAGSTS